MSHQRFLWTASVAFVAVRVAAGTLGAQASRRGGVFGIDLREPPSLDPHWGTRSAS